MAASEALFSFAPVRGVSLWALAVLVGEVPAVVEVVVFLVAAPATPATARAVTPAVAMATRTLVSFTEIVAFLLWMDRTAAAPSATTLGLSRQDTERWLRLGALRGCRRSGPRPGRARAGRVRGVPHLALRAQHDRGQALQKLCAPSWPSTSSRSPSPSATTSTTQ